MEKWAKVGDNSGAIDGAINTAESPLTTDADEARDTMAAADSIPGKAPAFQFYPNDFLADANVIVMSLQERGAYITLICVCWQQGSLPNDVAQLARFCGTPVASFRKIWPAVSACFKTASNDRLTHPRLERERRKQRDFRKLQSDKGKASAASRRAKPVEPESNRGSTAVQPTTGSPVQPKPNSSIFNLQSSSSDSGPKSVRAATGMAQIGTIHRGGHQRHSWCSERICVPDFTHDRLRRQLGRPDAETWLRGWYEVVVARLADIPIGEKPEDFWPREFAAEFPAEPKAGVSKLTAALAKASEW